MHAKTLLATFVAIFCQVSANEDKDKVYKHVALFSIDGAHASDIPKWIAKHSGSTIASLVKSSFWYSGAHCSAPSDSFPGLLNLVAGAGPSTTGVWYDFTWDRSFWPPFSESKKHCDGAPGAIVAYDESIDVEPTKLFTSIDPNNLPQAMIGGKCQAVYPHSRIRVNTIFEVVHKAGKQTAWADKHPAYDIVRGPSGAGLSVGYFPEINSLDTSNLTQIMPYDALHVDAFLKFINSAAPDHADVQEKLTGIPTLFGGNFQSVSVAQKSITGGYVEGTLAFSAQLEKAFQFVDDSLGKVVAELKKKNAYDDTLIVVCSKHGQAPIDPKLSDKVDPALFKTVIKVPISHITVDDVALVFLAKASDTEAAVDELNRNRDLLRIGDIISRERLTYLRYGDPATDPAVPHIIVKPDLGVIYTTSKKKAAEHGGLSDDDRNVACFFSASNIKYKEYDHRSSTAQVAPTILKALGLNPDALRGAVKEDTEVLSGFS